MTTAGIWLARSSSAAARPGLASTPMRCRRIPRWLAVAGFRARTRQDAPVLWFAVDDTVATADLLRRRQGPFGGQAGERAAVRDVRDPQPPRTVSPRD